MFVSKKEHIYLKRHGRRGALIGVKEDGGGGERPGRHSAAAPSKLEGAEVRGADAGFGLGLVADAVVDDLLAALVLGAQRDARRLLAGRHLRLLPLLLAALRGRETASGRAGGRARPGRPPSRVPRAPPGPSGRLRTPRCRPASAPAASASAAASLPPPPSPDLRRAAPRPFRSITT